MMGRRRSDTTFRLDTDMNKRCLALTLIFLLATLSGCITKDFSGDGSGLDGDAGDVTDDAAIEDTTDGASDAGDADTGGADTADSGSDADAEDASPDGSPDGGPECTVPEDCSVPDGTTGLAATCTDGKCGFECADGFVDLDGDLANGCDYECTFESDNDAPDAAGKDANCDGIDGMADEVIYVSGDNGDDANDGSSPENAVETIMRGILLAEVQTDDDGDPFDVLVAAGTYDEYISLKSGVSVHGGYSPDEWTRDIEGNVTEIKPTSVAATASEPHNRTVSASGLDKPTVLSGLDIYGYSFDPAQPGSIPGASTYAVWVTDSNDNLSIEHTDLFAGDAAAGADGQDGASGPGPDQCTPPANLDISGGTGATSQSSLNPCGNPTPYAPAGDNGRPTSQSEGLGGAGGEHICVNNDGDCDDRNNATPGAQGQPGPKGTNGAPGANWEGQISGNFWSPMPPEASPADGGYGSGGGGGGAGGNCASNGGLLNLGAFSRVGGNGGDGGHGGCPGTAATNGSAGGASIGLFVVDSLVSVTESTLALGKGGHGGDGGTGGAGGAGADGQFGSVGNGGAVNVSADDAGDGANGGDGGPGGDGGHGAGGCGGPSFGLVLGGSATAPGLEDQDMSNSNAARGVLGEGGGANSNAPAPDGCQADVQLRVSLSSN
jgi:hypothetical protein